MTPGDAIFAQILCRKSKRHKAVTLCDAISGVFSREYNTAAAGLCTPERDSQERIGGPDHFRSDSRVSPGASVPWPPAPAGGRTLAGASGALFRTRSQTCRGGQFSLDCGDARPV